MHKTIRPEVSVIIPVFNSELTLTASIESLLNQTLEALEIIIVDDGSTDSTRKNIEELSMRDARVVPIYLSKNSGAHEARLAGLRRASAPWIGFLDADDFANPKMFSSLLFSAKEQNVDIVICGSKRVNEQGHFLSSRVFFPASKRVEASVFKSFCDFKFGTGMLWNKLYRRQVIMPCIDLHFPWLQPINEDLLLNIGCFYRSTAVYLLKEPLHEYVVNSSSVTARLSKEEAFVYTFRAYALAVYLYKNLGKETLASIIDLYRKQLSWQNYEVLETIKMKPYEALLDDAVKLLLKTEPLTLAMLSARRPARRFFS